MININLLPETLRKKEGLPLPQLAGIFAGIAVLAYLAYHIINYHVDVIPSLKSRIESREQEKRNLQAQVEMLKKLNAEIDRKNQYVESVKSLYRQRIVWSKVLADIKSIVNFDDAMSEYNAEMRYLWFTNFTGRGRNISLKGYATAANQVSAMQMTEQLLHGFLNYAPATRPEKNEEERLQEELRRAVAEHEAERRDRPELPIQGPREIGIRQRLEEIKTIKSGGIALLPFNAMLVPGSLQLKNASWTSAPKPRTARGGNNPTGELFPDNAWTFTIDMTLK